MRFVSPVAEVNHFLTYPELLPVCFQLVVTCLITQVPDYIQVGEVTDIQLSFDMVNKTITVPVTVSIDYGRIARLGNAETATQLVTTRILF
jgi:hypothetical protein